MIRRPTHLGADHLLDSRHFQRHLDPHRTPDLHLRPDPHDGCPFHVHGHGRRMMDLHRRHALCPYQRKGFSKDFPYLYPGILEHFPCLHRIEGFGLDFDFRLRRCYWDFSGRSAAHRSRMESDFLCLGTRQGLQDFCFHRRGADSLFQPSHRAPVCHSCLNSANY